MRWNRPEFGDTRVITKFLWTPVVARIFVNNEEVIQARWLETATLEQKFDNNPGCGWWTIYFIDSKQGKEE